MSILCLFEPSRSGAVNMSFSKTLRSCCALKFALFPGRILLDANDVCQMQHCHSVLLGAASRAASRIVGPQQETRRRLPIADPVWAFYLGKQCNRQLLASFSPISSESLLFLAQCREHARSIPGKAQVFVNAYAKAIEVIPRQLCDNAGFDATDVLSRLRNKHSLPDDRGKHFGIDIATGAVPHSFP